jgi:hypothetical protein
MEEAKDSLWEAKTIDNIPSETQYAPCTKITIFFDIPFVLVLVQMPVRCHGP